MDSRFLEVEGSLFAWTNGTGRVCARVEAGRASVEGCGAGIVWGRLHSAWKMLEYFLLVREMSG